MPLSKRFKDAFYDYQRLAEDLRIAEQLVISSQSTYTKAKRAMEEKIREILKETESCFPATPAAAYTRVAVVGDKTYLITNSPRHDTNAPIPPYITEVQMEKVA